MRRKSDSNSKRRKNGRKRKLFLTFMVMILLAVGVLLGFSVLTDLKIMPNSPNGQLTTEELKNSISVLLIGADQRPGEEKFNTDTIILATIDPKSARVSLLSIPRDTRVSIPGYKNIKINGVAPLTDLENLVDVVADLTGVPIAGYIQTNFNGFKQIIDTLGGITVDVEKDMYYETGDAVDGIINLQKGLQQLDGAQALQYARFRNDALADISRTARQQVVLKAVAEEMLQLSTLPKLPWLIPQLNDAVNSNVELRTMFKMSTTVVKFKDISILTQTLPGRFHDINGISYWDVDREEAQRVVSNLFRGITTEKVIDDTVIDLLEPIEPIDDNPLPQVPGSPVDPNGQESSEYQDAVPDAGNPQEEADVDGENREEEKESKPQEIPRIPENIQNPDEENTKKPNEPQTDVLLNKET
ncbi:transcriptional attenuator, LytR family [Desulfitobacterium dichloroeliminans LMG P-21439]|uniref:Transcriptional attenuator, LytR family n=2 Tax=Desulfitobacterium dichloroeliminans TaxID=233055 RepID=L0F8U5_DESDL|nr:transcriptional attenuator, LytR family [Desulfitobacterium dichloroeliminans LMG P-21439]